MMMFSFNNVSFVFGSAFDNTTIVIFIHSISQGGISWISHFININISLYIFSISIFYHHRCIVNTRYIFCQRKILPISKIKPKIPRAHTLNFNLNFLCTYKIKRYTIVFFNVKMTHILKKKKKGVSLKPVGFHSPVC